MTAERNPHPRPLRILRVIHTLRRESGGPSESVLRSTQALLQLGHHVEVITADPAGTSRPGAAGFPFHPVGGYDDATLGTWLRAQHHRFDVVLMHGLWQGGWTVNVALRGTGKPYLVFPHGMLDPWFRRAYPLKHLKKQLYWWARENRVLREAAAVCFTCEEERRLARGTFLPYQVRERVVSYGTAGPEKPGDDAQAAFFARFPVLTSRRFVLFLGRIHDKKGVRELIRAQAALRSEHPQAPSIVIAGPAADTSFAAELRQLAESVGLPQLDLLADPVPASHGVKDGPSVIWLPMLGDDLKWGALFASEALVLPSHQENFGIAVAEALACGRPVLISDKVNIWREIVADGAGLVAPDTVAGTTTLLRGWHMLASAERAAMGRAARECFVGRFEITRAALSLAATAATCLAKPAAPGPSLNAPGCP